MKNLYLAQVCRKNRGDWDEFRNHQYDAYNADEGDIVDMPWGEKALVVLVQSGVIYLDGDFTDEEREDGADIEEFKKYVFLSEDGIFHTQIYRGDMYMYDFPYINEYHHKNAFEIDLDFATSEDYEITSEYDWNNPPEKRVKALLEHNDL